jgi:hypothetical protein
MQTRSPFGRFVLSNEENPGYSVFCPINSLFGQKIFPVLTFREFSCKVLKLMRDLMSKFAKPIEKSQNALLFSLFSGNSRAENGAIAVPGRIEIIYSQSWPGLSRPSTSSAESPQERRGCPRQARA